MMQRKCPWCTKKFETSAYPRSAGLGQIRGEELKHISEEHAEKEEKFKKMKSVWEKKVFDDPSTVEILWEMITKREIPELPREVVSEYSVEDFEEMNQEQLRDLAG